jgi:hypothetical protein
VEKDASQTDLENSCLEVDELTAQYVGKELTHVAALAELPPGLPDTPLDADVDVPADPAFALSCQLASELLRKDQPGGKLLNFQWDGGKVSAIVENHAVANVKVLFHAKGEECKSNHEHKVEIDATVAKQRLKDTIKEMASLSTKLDTKTKQVQLRNVAVHSLLTMDEEEPLASCEEVSQQVKAAMPAKATPTSLGAAALEPGRKEVMGLEELREFLRLHDLEHLKDTVEGLEWRAKKLQFALNNNSKLINPKLSKERRKQLLELLIESAEVLATKIEDLKTPCSVPPVDIPTSSPPIRQKAYKLSPTDLAFLEPTIQSMLKAGILQSSSSPWASPVFVVYRQHHESAK